MRSKELIGMATAAALLAGCGNSNISADSVVDCKGGPYNGRVEFQLHENQKLNIGRIAVKSLGNGQADIQTDGAVIFGTDTEPSKQPGYNEALVTGSKSISVRPIGRWGGFSPTQPVHNLTVGRGENGTTKITATFICDKLSQPNTTLQNK